MEETDRKGASPLLQQFGRRYAPGALLFAQGEVAHEVFMVHEGRVRVFKRVRDAERTLAIVRPGELLGETALLPSAVRSASAMAMVETTVLALDPETFGAMLERSPELGLRVMRQIVRRLRDQEAQVEATMIPDAHARVLSALLHLAADEQPGVARDVSLAATPLDLAARCAVDVDGVRRAIGILREQGYVEVGDDRVVLRDLAALRTLFDLVTQHGALGG